MFWQLEAKQVDTAGIQPLLALKKSDTQLDDWQIWSICFPVIIYRQQWDKVST